MPTTTCKLANSNVASSVTGRSAPAPMHAGGRATEAGMAFQAAVASWFASHLLARTPVGGRFGLNNAAIPISIQLETGDGLAGC